MPDTMFMKERMLITGGHALQGTVHISGGKNTAVAVIPATLLCDEPCTIENLPDISDVHALVDILCSLGAKVNYEPNRFMTVDPRPAEGWQVSYRDSQRLRASYYLLGALLGRRGQAEVYQPGGCEIGSRPIDQHLKGFRMLGANVEQMGGRIKAKADVLTGTDVVFDCVSVGATINVMLAAAKAHGTTIIYNAAKEPHVVDLANFLNSMGARVKGAGTDVIRIFGRDYLHGANYTVIPDQIETGTLMIAAAAGRGEEDPPQAVIAAVAPTTAEAFRKSRREIIFIIVISFICASQHIHRRICRTRPQSLTVLYPCAGVFRKRISSQYWCKCFVMFLQKRTKGYKIFSRIITIFHADATNIQI